MSDTKAFQLQQNTGSYNVPTSSLATLSFPGALITRVTIASKVTAMRGWGGEQAATQRVRGMDHSCSSSGTEMYGGGAGRKLHKQQQKKDSLSSSLITWNPNRCFPQGNMLITKRNRYCQNYKNQTKIGRNKNVCECSMSKWTIQNDGFFLIHFLMNLQKLFWLWLKFHVTISLHTPVSLVDTTCV